MSHGNLKYDRIMLKISGEALGGDDGTGIDPEMLKRVCGEISDVVKSGKQVGVVMGAGNFFRGVKGIAGGMDQVAADQMGMLATLLNAIALRDGLARAGADAEVLSANPVGPVGETYSPYLGRELLSSGKVALCAAGTGNPFFTTDTAAVLRALELGCDVMLKATKVDGVYDKDPVKHPDATRYETISYTDVLEMKLGIMDLTAVALADENDLPLVVFNLNEKGTMMKVAEGEIQHGTLIRSAQSLTGPC